MRGIPAFAGATFFLIACGTSSAENGETCSPEGTFTLTSTVATQSDGCGTIFSGSDEPMAVTITRAGDAYSIELEGLSGSCPGTLIEGCKLQAKCDGRVAHPLNPSQTTATLQFSWAFTAAGFEGSSSLSYPQMTEAPQGCRATLADKATRR